MKDFLSVILAILIGIPIVMLVSILTWFMVNALLIPFNTNVTYLQAMSITIALTILRGVLTCGRD